MSLKGKKIIITGCSQGIGEAVVTEFAKSDATVMAMDVKDEAGLQVVEKSKNQGQGIVHYLHCDISNRSEVESAFGEAVSRMGGLDVLVNVAGVHRHASPEDIQGDVYELLTKVNILGTMNTNAVAYKYFLEQGAGNIINFGSESGLIGELNNALYSSTKAAVHAWTRTVARQWGPDGIRVNAVLPYVVTPMYEAFRAALTPEELAAHDEATKKDIPLGGKFGDPVADLTPVLIFLAGDGSKFITGQMIPVDGGLVAVR